MSPRTISDLERGVTRTARRATANLLADALQLAAPLREQFLGMALGLPPAPVTAPERAGGPVAAAVGAVEMRYVLPPDPFWFTGRDAELGQIVAAVTSAADSGGVVAIHAIEGMPGVGKTALAVRAAYLLGDRFPDRQLFVDLHGYTPGREPVPALEALAGLLSFVGVDARLLPEGIAERAALWRDRMAGQRAVLVLDNAAGSAQVAPLLPSGKDCAVLVTSRRQLGDLPGAVVPVPVAVLAPGQAEQMFLQLSGRPVVSSAAVAELVRLAGYLPLAISLLARVYARHPTWALSDLIAETRTRMLNLSAEYSSVATAFEVSYRCLTHVQQQFLRRLGVHPGVSIEAYAGAALAGTDLAGVSGCLEALYREGLLTEIGYRRYGMHDLIRRYVRDLAASDTADERQLAMERLLDFYASTAALAEARFARYSRPRTSVASPESAWETPALLDGAGALAWARAERSNLLACLDYATKTRRHAWVVSLTAGVAALLRDDGPWTDAITRHTAAIRAAQQCGDRLGQASARIDLGTVLSLVDRPEAVRVLEEALAIYHDLGDRLGQANALNAMGPIRRLRGDRPGAARNLEEALSIYRDLGDRLGQASALNALAQVRRRIGDYPAAVRDHQEALDIYRELGHRLGEAIALEGLGNTRRWAGYPGAVQALEESLHIFGSLGYRSGEASALNLLGIMHQQSGNYRSAIQAHEEAISVFRELGDRLAQANALNNLGMARRQTGDLRGAVLVLREALDICREIGFPGGEFATLDELGILYRDSGDLDLARSYHQQALQVARESADPWSEADALRGLGHCALDAGDVDQARVLLQQSQELLQRLGSAEAAGVTAELLALTQGSQAARSP